MHKLGGLLPKELSQHASVHSSGETVKPAQVAHVHTYTLMHAPFHTHTHTLTLTLTHTTVYNSAHLLPYSPVHPMDAWVTVMGFMIVGLLLGEIYPLWAEQRDEHYT